MKQINNFCPCRSTRSSGSNKSKNFPQKLYSECCGIFISGQAIPNTAEKLMRSRYTAYTQGNMDYIQATMQGQALLDFDPEASKDWCLSIRWQALRILESYLDKTNPDQAYVSFSALYKSEGRLYELKETSIFLKQAERWFYMGEEETKHNHCGDTSCGHHHA